MSSTSERSERGAGETPPPRAPHPVVWTILYLPFGALSGFVSVALTFLATQHGLSISEGALLNGANLLTQWMKWLWAPAIDVTLTPRRWYVIATAASAVGVFAMCVIPLGPSTLWLLLAVIAVASLINSIVGMSIEALMSISTPPDQIGRVSAWFQAGNLGGAGLGGALGLFLVRHLPPVGAGLIMAASFMACCLALRFTPAFAKPHHETPAAAVKSVIRDLGKMLKTKGGVLSAVLCVMPVGTGAAQATLAQAKVAELWHAGAAEVEWIQGLLAGGVTALGCFIGGWVCARIHARTAYAIFGICMAAAAALMAASPMTVPMYIAWNLIYSLTVGFSYAGFTAICLTAMGAGSGATKYNVFASLSNFPIWWLGLVLGVAADKLGARAMLLTEAGFGVLGVLIFFATAARVRRSKLADSV